MNEAEWLPWARKLQAIAQAGLTYSHDPLDVARFREVQTVAAEITARHSHLSVEVLKDLFERESGYVTPKVAVRAAVFHGADVLLVHENAGHWSLPGGYADVSESPSEAVARETLEESGFLVRATRLLAVYDVRKRAPGVNPFRPFYTLFFDCAVVEQTRLPDLLETTEAAFFPIDALPPLRAGWMVNEITRLFELHQNGSMPPDFD